MRKVLTFILAFMALDSFAQTEIREKKYKMSWEDNDNLLIESWDITIPYLSEKDD